MALTLDEANEILTPDMLEWVSFTRQAASELGMNTVQLANIDLYTALNYCGKCGTYEFSLPDRLLMHLILRLAEKTRELRLSQR